jgi:DNA-binding response OmpR family regulator
LYGAVHFSKEELEPKDSDPAKFAIRNDEFDEFPIEYSSGELYMEPVIDKAIPSILLIEDNEELLSILQQSFVPYYNVYTAGNGEDGLKKVFSVLPDIVVSDVMMPGMSGKELCQQIKNDINTSLIPVVLLTAQASDAQVLDGFMVGADAYITKPFNLKILIQNCNNILRSRRLMYDKVISQNKAMPAGDTSNGYDNPLINKAIEIIKQNFDNPHFDMNQLGAGLGLGRSKLYTKIKEITGFTPNEFTLNIKMSEALYLLEHKPHMNISEIAIHLGFSSAKYFSKCFKTYYGNTPQEQRKKDKQDESASIPSSAEEEE